MNDNRDQTPDPDAIPDPLMDHEDGAMQPKEAQQPSPSAEPIAESPAAPAGKPKKAEKKKPVPGAAAKESDLKLKGVYLVAGLVGVGVVVVIVLAVTSRSSAQTVKPRLKSQIDTAEDVDAKYKIFMNQMNSQVPQALEQGKKNQEQISRIETAVQDALRKMQEDRARDQKRLDDALAKLTAQAEGLSVSKQGTMVSGDLDAFVSALKAQKIKGNLNLDEARLRLEAWLKANGFDGPGLAVLRDRRLDELGFLYVGDVQEPPLSDAELQTLPEVLRPLCRSLAERNFQDAAFSGRVLLRGDDAMAWLDKQLTGKPPLPTDEQKKACVELARVRKSNVTPEMEELLPDLAAKRDSLGIQPSQLIRLESYVFDLKKTKFPAMTPGQHLSLVMTLAGLRTNTNGQFQGNVRQAKPDDLSMVAAAARDAAKVALGQGIQDQRELFTRARNAAAAKTADLKLALTADQVEQAVTIGVAEAVRGAANGPNPVLDALAGANLPSSAKGPTKPATPAMPAKPRTLHRGPVELTREQAGLDAALLANVVIERLRLDPMSPEGAAVASALLTAAPDLASAAWTASYNHDQDLGTFTTTVLDEFQAIARDARAVASTKPRLQGLPAAEAAIAQAIELGRVIGSTAGAESKVIDQAVRKRLDELAKDGLSVHAPEKVGDGWAGFLAWYGALGQQVAGRKPQQAAALFTLASQQLKERPVAHEQVSLPGLPATFRDRVVRELNDSLPVSLPAIIAARDDSRLQPEALRAAVVQAQNRFAMASAAEAVLTQKAQTAIAEKFAQLIDDDKMLPTIYAAVGAWIPEHIHATLESSKPELADGNIGPVAVDTAGVLADPLMSFLARTVIETNLDPRIRTAGGSLNPAAVESALAAIHDKLETMDFLPFSLSRMDQASQDLHQFGLAQLQAAQPAVGGAVGAGTVAGGAPGSAAARPTAPGKGGTTNLRPGFWTIKDEGLPGLPMGQRNESVQQGMVFGIPRGSAMQCYLEIGIDLPIKSAEAGQDLIQLRAVGGFFGPDGNWYPFPPCILQGKAKPNPGADRNSVMITSITALVGKQTLDKEMSGVVTDERGGMNGMLAVFDRHSEKVLPEAGLLALLEGSGQALAEVNTQTTQVVPGSTTITQDPGNSFKTGIGKGVEKGVGLLEKYQESYLEKISPTMRSWNGQKLVAYFFSTVEFSEMTAEQWRAYSARSSGDYNGFR